MIESPEWKSYQYPQDDKFQLENFPVKWPGYINNKEHPLMFCHSLTHQIDGVLTNEWCSSDGPNEFKNNLLKAPQDWHYRTKKITYKVNKSGFRTIEFDDIDWKNSIVLFGDSCTFGVGVDEDETVSYYLSKLMNKPVINLGVPGGSNDLIVQMCSLVFENFGVPEGVGILWSTTDRFRYYTERRYMEAGPWLTDKKFNHVVNDVDIGELWKLTFYDKHNELTKNYFLGTQANAIWKDRCKYVTGSFYDLSAFYARADFAVKIDNQARDMVHQGRGSNLEAAKQFAKLFNEQL